MALPEEVLFAPVRELSERIKKKELSPVELTEAYLARAERIGGELHSWATITRDLALTQAHKAADELAAGAWRGPLHGIPYAAKDLLALRWYPTTWGAAPLAHQKLADDAAVIQRLTDAGAVLLGKAAMVELAGGLGYRFPSASATGVALNPWDKRRWTCGSSSGSGAIVASGQAAFAIGSETWGSILCPSAHCGITGLRPTYGRVSRRGAMALSYSLDKIGPMARTADDCAIVLAAIAAHDPGDESSLPQADAQFRWPLPPDQQRKALRIGVVSVEHIPAAIDAACRAAVDVLRKAGCTVEAVTLPEGPWTAATLTILWSEASAALRPLIRSGQVQELADPLGRIDGYLYETIPAADFETAQRVRLIAQKKMSALYQKYDLLAAPARGELAFATDANLETGDDVPDPLGCLGNLCGLPAISVPCGISGGLPIGVQLVARALDEHAALFAATQLQARTDWHKKRPPAA
jgi:aspartyl-tRNA(Asn)/glutamyl-tRNA(Gln) amidotransferase subunit A